MENNFKISEIEMIENQQKRNILFGIFVFSAIVLGILFLYTVKYGVLLIITACMFGTIINGPVNLLQRHKVPRFLGLILCLLVIIGFFYSINMLVIPKAVPEFAKLVKEFPIITVKWDAQLEKVYNKLSIEQVTGQSYPQFKNTGKLAAFDKFGVVIKKLKEISKNQFENLLYVVICLIMTVYVVLDPKGLEKGFLDPWNRSARKKVRRCMLRIQRMLYSWAIGLCFGCMCIFLLTWLGLSLVHFPFGFFFAAFAGCLNIIPTIGPIISAVVPCLLMLVINPKMVIYVLVIYLAVQQIESNFLTPMIMKKQLDVHPMILIIAIVGMGYYYGTLGCLMAAPIMASVRIIYEEFYQKPKLLREKKERELREKEVQNG